MISLKKYFFAVFLFVTFISKAQFSGYTFCDWDKIAFNPKYSPSNSDTAIVFVSVRNYFPDKAEFLDYEFDVTNSLHYFTIFFNQNKWICVPKLNLEEAIKDAAKNKDFVVYGEGMGKTFPSAVDRATRLTRLYDVVTIMFDWPSHRPGLSGSKDYKTARLQCKDISKPMVKLFNEINDLKQAKKIADQKMALLLHSLGNRLIKEAVTNNFLEVKTKLFDNIVLNAACVKMRGHKKWLEKLIIQDKIYVTRNNHDRTLNLARIAGLSKRLGMHNRWRKANNAIYLNFSEPLKHEHNYFLMNNLLRRHPDIKLIYDDIFHAKNISFDDIKKYRSRKNGRVITLIKPHVSQDGDISLGIGM